jgi:hypothetical protein
MSNNGHFFSKKRVLLTVSILMLVFLVIFFLPERREQLKTDHFTFTFSKSIDVSKINRLASSLENSYERIANDLKTEPADNIEVYFYAQRWRYIKATGNWSASGNIEGIARMHFVEEAWGEEDSKKVAIHEFAHTVTLKLLIENEMQPLNAEDFDKKFAAFPVWLWEALSVYEADQFIDPGTLPFFNNGSYPGISELNDRSKGGKIYKVGYTVIEYIVHEYGQDKLLELVKKYGDLSNVLGVSEDQFCKDWSAFVRQKYL